MSASPVPRPPLRTLASALATHWAVLAALGLFILASLAILDDYRYSPNENPYRIVGGATIDYVLGRGDALFGLPHRFNGVALELPLEFIERTLRLDGFEVSAARRLLTHFLFLSGGLFAYLLTQRLFGNRLLALIAMLLFLLHPRLYTHSFINNKDLPFVGMSMIAMFLAHRAFKKDTIAAFALLGIGVGAMMNMRLMGAVLFLAILTGRGLDLLWAFGGGKRKRILLSAGAFVLAAALTMYGSWPYLWDNPSERLWESLRPAESDPFEQEWPTIGSPLESLIRGASYLVNVTEQFRGVPISSQDLPSDYIPTWFSITTPPFALLLGTIGAGALLLRWRARPVGRLRNTSMRFGLLAAGCIVAPVAGAVLLGATLFNGWRHFYFLWAPFTLLAAFGLHWLVSAFTQRRQRTLVYWTAAIGIGLTALSMALLHPVQHIYFNFFEDRVTRDNLSERFILDYWNLSLFGLYKEALRKEPGTIAIQFRSGIGGSLGALPNSSRRRISLVNSALADFSVSTSRPEAGRETLYVKEIYNNMLSALVKEYPQKNPFSAAYEAAVSLDPIVRSSFDLYALDRALVYVKEPCGTSDLKGSFYLRFYPVNPYDLLGDQQRFGYGEAKFRFLERGALFDGKCIGLAPVPDHAVLNVHAYQFYAYGNELHWSEVFPIDAAEHYAAYETAAGREPDVRAAFDLHLNRQARTLTYVKEPCALSDVERKFFLHIAPERVDDLPQNRREHGFDNMDFEYLTQGIVFDGKCVAVLPLPNYAIERIRTGQFERGEDEVWEARLRF